MDRKQRLIDWEPIKQEYITSNTSYRRLADKHGIDHQRIAERGKAEGWVALRGQYRSNLVAAVEAAAVDAAVEEGLAAVRQIGDVARESIEMIKARIADAGSGTQMEAALGALRTALGVIRDCYALETVDQQHRRETDREKLEIDRGKLELAQRQAERGQEEDGGIVISIEGAEDYAG